ncbi:cop9 signalosome complex subunit 12 [Stagonosporopsis vannaccii]|nr:cop9 signalosome complex subunit 12 [Stagonosporopsis vannaccii]
MFSSHNSAGVETQLCTAVNNAIKARNAVELASIVLLEPPFPPIYQELVQSLQNSYPQNANNSEDRLDQLVRRVVTETAEYEDEQGKPVQGWNAMVSFLVGWMIFLRDMDLSNLLHTYQGLKDLQEQANSALTHPIKGVLILPTIVNYARVFSRVALGLDKHPELIQHLLTSNDEGSRESLSEKAANVVRGAFTQCLNDRVGTQDKKLGIYKMANICLKILFQADKPESCETIFRNITNSSPPLQMYPKPEQVTYLYYLGRYHFANTNFYGAQLVLDHAYDLSSKSPQFNKQRRLILIYLIASNMIIGRLPTQHIYLLPEAQGLDNVFDPIAKAIKSGNVELFRRITNPDLSGSTASWLMKFRIFYQIGNYCEVLVWRSLFRTIYRKTGQEGGQEGGMNASKAAVLDLSVVQAAFAFLEGRAKIKNAAVAQQGAIPGHRNFGHLFQDHASVSRSSYVDPDFAGVEGVEPYNHEVDVTEAECICATLITQGFVAGYIDHASGRLAISGARRQGGAAQNGFPAPFSVIKGKNSNDVLGWKKDAGGVVQGQVIRMSGAKAVGE